MDVSFQLLKLGEDPGTDRYKLVEFLGQQAHRGGEPGERLFREIVGSQAR